MKHRVLRVEVTARTFAFAVLALFGVWLFIRLLPVVLVLVIALMMVGTLGPAVEWLERKQFRRGGAIAVVFGVLFLAVGVIGAVTVPELVNQVKNLIEREPAMREQIAQWLGRSPLTANLADVLRNVRYDALIKSGAGDLLEYSTRFLEGVAYGVGAIFLALYMMIDRDRLRGALFAVVPRTQHIRLSRILVNLETIVGGYIRGQAITCALMGLFMFILLFACGVPNALAIAVFGGLADVLPYVGIFLTMGPAVAAALPLGTGITIVVFLLMLAYEEFESRVLVPLVYGRALRLPSSVVLLSLITGATLLGIIGALLALPVAATILMLIDELRVELPGEAETADHAETKMKDEQGEREYERRTEGLPAEEAAAIAVEIAGERKKAEQPPSS